MGGALKYSKKGNSKIAFLGSSLFTKIEILNDCTIAIDVLSFEVIEQCTAFSNQSDQCALCPIILFVDFQMFGKVTNPKGE